MIFVTLIPAHKAFIHEKSTWPIRLGLWKDFIKFQLRYSIWVLSELD